jgi:hypothetical protein
MAQNWDRGVTIVSRFLTIVIAIAICLGCLRAEPAVAGAPGRQQTFFVGLSGNAQESAGSEDYLNQYTAALEQRGLLRLTEEAHESELRTECIGEVRTPIAKRACTLAMARAKVDLVFVVSVSHRGGGWNWAAKALSRAQGAEQVWAGAVARAQDEPEAVTVAACERLAAEFACSQGNQQVCASIGFVPGSESGKSQAAVSTPSPEVAVPRRASFSALDVFEVAPNPVSVWIDGKPVGTSASQITGIAPGEREVTLKSVGYFDQTQRITFDAGKRQVIRGMRLRKTTASLVVRLISPREASVLIGGVERGSAGGVIGGLEPGDVDVVVRAPGYRDLLTRITFVAGEESEVQDVSLEPLPMTVTVRANVLGAAVYVDGEVVGETTTQDDVFVVGHDAKEIVIRLEGYRRWKGDLSPDSSGAVTFIAELDRASGDEEPEPDFTASEVGIAFGPAGGINYGAHRRNPNQLKEEREAELQKEREKARLLKIEKAKSEAPALIAFAVKRMKPGLIRCYEWRAMGQSSRELNVVARFQIGATGAFHNVEMEGGDHFAAEVWEGLVRCWKLEFSRVGVNVDDAFSYPEMTGLVWEWKVSFHSVD